MFFSTSLAVALEIACYILFAVSGDLRLRLMEIVKHPASIALGCFAATIIIATFYGIGPWYDRLEALAGWRKLLLFYLAAAVFHQPEEQDRFVRILIGLCIVMSLVSWIAFFVPLPFRQVAGGIVFKDYVIQASVFAVAAGAVIIRGTNWFNLLIAVSLLLNIAFVTPARAGYLAALVITVVIAIGIGGKRAVAMAGICIVVFSLSPQVHQRIQRGFVEASTVEQSSRLTSIGWRVVMWRNTMNMIRRYPWLGTGTGSFETVYSMQVADVKDWQGQATNDPHNQYLKIWAEQGVVGILAFVAFITALIFARRRADLFVAVLLAWCAAGIFASSFSRFTEGRFIFLWSGVMIAGPVYPFVNKRSR